MMNNSHNSPLNQHFQDKIFWTDLVILSALVGISFSSLIAPYEIVQNVLRITTIIAGLELIGFLSFHLFEQRKGILLQGFLGGFVSSTMTFIEFTQNKDFERYSVLVVTQALLFATLAMTIQSFLIVLSLIPTSSFFPILSPLILYAAALLLCIVLLQLKVHKSTELLIPTHHLLEDRPIVWKKVFTFSLLMLTLIYSMRFLSQTLSLPVELSAFLVSFFEAHGVLAAGLAQLKSAQEWDNSVRLIIIVLAGQSLSKIFLVWRSKFAGLFWLMFFCLGLSAAISWLALLF